MASPWHVQLLICVEICGFDWGLRLGRVEPQIGSLPHVSSSHRRPTHWDPWIVVRLLSRAARGAEWMLDFELGSERGGEWDL